LYDTKAGHAGGRPIGKIVEDESLELAFLVPAARHGADAIAK
jgi:hypothetical protein